MSIGLGWGDILVGQVDVILADRAEDVERSAGPSDGDGAMRHVRWDDEGVSRLADTRFIADGELHPASWDEALERAATGLLGVKERHGADALGFVSSSRCTGEENFLIQKFARAVLGTNNVHSCAAT